MSAFRTAAASDAAPSRRRALLVTLSLLHLLIVVDVTVVTIALPSIGADLDADAGSLTWVVTGYTVVGGGLMLLGGRLCDTVGRRRLLMIGAALFGVASLAAGLAPTLDVLILARFAQGAGEALATPAALSSIALAFPAGRDRARAFAVWGAVSSTGLVLGVLLSGALTEFVHWRAIFLINPPLVLVVLVAVPLLLSADRSTAQTRLDLPGALLLTVSPLAVVFGAVRAAERPLADPTVVGPVVAGVLGLGLLTVVERRVPNPLLPPGILAHRGRLVANVATALLSAALSTTFFLSTLYLQRVLGLGPLSAGLAFLPFCVALLAALAVVARSIDVVGLRATALVGLLTAAVGTAWLARAPRDGSVMADVVPGMVAVAVGMGLALVALQNTALTDVDTTDAGVAAGTQRCADQLGGAIGLAVLAGWVFGNGSPAATDGYRAAYLAATVAVVIAMVLVAAVGRSVSPSRTPATIRQSEERP